MIHTVTATECADGIGTCDKRYHCVSASINTCKVTRGVCKPTIPVYLSTQPTTNSSDITQINDICASANNAYSGVTVKFNPSMAHYAQLHAEYLVHKAERGETVGSVHQKCKLNLFPELETIQGNVMEYRNGGYVEDLKKALKVWYDEGASGDHYKAMVDNNLVGCGVAKSGNIIRVVAWYGKPKSNGKWAF
uniref:SCP domain-containing protein n=1 Tax=Clytia hemisphaerica TaxID=252671 RepID=A0A7M5VAA2_9CNID